MTGELAALGAALVWAIGGLLLKRLSTSFHSVLLVQIRCIAAVTLLAIILLATGGFASLSQVPPRAVVLVVAGTFLTIGVGESLLVQSLRYIDLTRAYPILICGYPVVTLILSFFFLHEKLAGLTLLGALLVLTGLYLVARPSGSLVVRFSFTSSGEKTGMLLILLAVLVSGGGTILVRQGMQDLDPTLANFLRFSGTAILLLPFTFSHWTDLGVRKSDWRIMGTAVLGGALSLGLGGILFVLALKESGAALTSVLSSTSSLFLLPMAVLFLKEKVTPKLVSGVVLSVLGICLVLLPGLV